MSSGALRRELPLGHQSGESAAAYHFEDQVPPPSHVVRHTFTFRITVVQACDTPRDRGRHYPAYRACCPSLSADGIACGSAADGETAGRRGFRCLRSGPGRGRCCPSPLPRPGHGAWRPATIRDTCSRSPPTQSPGSATVIALQFWTPTDFRCAVRPVSSSGAFRRHAVHEVWIASCYKPSRR